ILGGEDWTRMVMKRGLRRQEKKRTARRRQAERRIRDARRLSDQQLLGALASMGGDPLHVVHAWASSPMGVHRHLSLSTAVQAAVRAAATNRAPGTPGGEAAAAWDLVVCEAAGLAVLEDAQPWDPRLPAVGRFGGHLYRLYPGMLERPVAALRTAELVAITIDPALVPRLRFGLGDLMSVCLTHMVRAVGLLAPAWPEGDLPEIGTPPSVTSAEISAAKGVVEWLGLDSPLLHAGRAAAALEWAAVKPEYLRADLAQDMTGTCFGTAMAVAAPGGRLLALPLPYIAEGWQHAVGVLAEAADRDDATTADRWLRTARAETLRLIERVRDMPDPVLVSTIHGPVAVLPFGRRHLLAVAVAASLSPGCDAEPATEAVGAIRPGSRLRCQPGFLDVPSDAEVVRLVVVATAGTSAVRAPMGMAVLTLEDLARISDTAGRADELFAFCRDLGDPPGGVELFGWEMADTWELWQAEQAIHVMGRAPDAMYVAAHQVGEAEWEQAAKQAWIEQALHRVGMPPARALRELDVDGDKVIALTGDMEIWHMILLGEAVIAATSSGTE